MIHVVLVIHLFVALAIVGLVLLQRSEGGGLGIGGGGGGLGNFASARGTANALTRMTAICAAIFFCTSLLLGILAGHAHRSEQSLMDAINDAAKNAKVSASKDVGADNAEPSATKEDSAPVAPIAK